MKIVSIGDLVTDFYYKNGRLAGVNGGSTSQNIIANLASFNLETSVYGICGNDAAGNIAINSLKDINVDVDNIKVVDNLTTRCFHVSYLEENGISTFKSKKRCPKCECKKWYDESQIDSSEVIKKISKDDILVFDNLNSKNQDIIDNCANKKILDLGQYFELESCTTEKIINKLQNKFDLINLNERVEKYLKAKFSITESEDLYKLLNPKMLIITKGKQGAEFIVNGTKMLKKIDKPAQEIDPTGAGDAFFSVFIASYIKNNFIIDDDFIDSTFEEAIKLTKKVVRKFGARGHIQNLYKIKQVKGECTCTNFELSIRKKIKRCNINVNNLETRVINAINSGAYDKLLDFDFKKINCGIFIGTGGSFAGAKFSAKLINYLYGVNTSALYPRDLYYRNNDNVDSVFLFTYSGTTNDLLVSTSLIENKNKYIITKGEPQKVEAKTEIPKENIISYRTNNNKGKERGFLSFEGALAPASLFLKLYFSKKSMDDVEVFIKDSISYWKNYFENYFKENKQMLKEFFKKGSYLNIFTGDETQSAGSDLESKIIESGIYNCLVHEKKNFSHGRFINYEHLSDKKNIYFKQNKTSSYEKRLLEYLEKDQNLIIESRYDGILCEYDLLVASQYLIYYISNFLDIDISKPTYTEDAMKIYFYKGEL